MERLNGLSINSKQTYNVFIDVLKSLSKNESINDYNRHVAIINTSQKIIGISMADIRKLARVILNGDYISFLDYQKNLNKNDMYYEETLIEGLVISGIKNLNEQTSRLKYWIYKIDNWSTCDSVCCSLKRLKKAKNKNEFFNFFKNLCYLQDEFVCRFGLVSIMSNYLEQDYLQDILDICKSIKSDKYYINMALAWLISYLFMKFKIETYKLLETKELSKFVQNKAISKCRDSYQVDSQDKEKLISLRIK